jgi:hypothetical protein
MSVGDNFDLGPKYEGQHSGDEVRWDDLRFPAQAVSSGAAPPSAEAATGLLLFSGATTNTVAGVAQMPHAWLEESTIIPHVHFQKTTSASGNVFWRLEYELVNNGSVAAMDYGTVLDVTTPVGGTPDNDTANECLISSFGNVSMRDQTISSLIFWKLSRMGGEALDTYDAANARLIELDFHYIVDGRGSRQQFTKTDWGK